MGWIPGWDSVASVGWWSGFYFWISIACLIGLGVAEVASHRYGERKDELAAVEQDAKDKRHDEDMARLQHEAAQATERAAKLEKEAAGARLEQERLKQLVVWRSIPNDSAQILASLLAKKPTEIRLMVVANDPEAMQLASQITTILDTAKWKANAVAASWGNLLPIGIHIYGSDAATVDLLKQSFFAAQISFDPSPVREPDTSIIFGGTSQTTILIGSRVGAF